MTREQIIQMAREAWLSDKEAQLITEFDEVYISCTYLQDLEAFAKLVASAEREACAKMCEKLSKDMEQMPAWGAQTCANQIRARNKE
jgi:hypothetical protein